MEKLILSTNEKYYEWAFATIGGLLASSCCVIQLGLNTMSLGCAGFSVLTPYRPVFLSMTGIFLGTLFFRQGMNKNTLTTSAIALTLTLSPEMVKMWNLNKLPFFSSSRISTATEKVVLQVEGIACESCASKVKSAILSITGVEEKGAEMHFHYDSVSTLEVKTTIFVPDQKLLEVIALSSGSENIEESPYKATIIKREAIDAKQ